eukprot:SAG22_NODE_2041_length_3091_cov_7.971925_3_plen_118_part_01
MVVNEPALCTIVLCNHAVAWKHMLAAPATLATPAVPAVPDGCGCGRLLSQPLKHLRRSWLPTSAHRCSPPAARLPHSNTHGPPHAEGLSKICVVQGANTRETFLIQRREKKGGREGGR